MHRSRRKDALATGRTATLSRFAALLALIGCSAACDYQSHSQVEVEKTESAFTRTHARAAAAARSPRPRDRGRLVQEATIGEIHRALQRGTVTCTEIVEAYIARARAYNGPCTKLVTADGAAISPGPGAVRTGTPIAFPSETVAVSTVLPDVDQYMGLPLDLGRMEATVSDPSVQQQAGMRVGIPDAGQVNALETFNLRGERSVTCKGACDALPSAGPLPAGCPATCEAFRQQPDALEHAAYLDRTYGRRPDLREHPMYCIPFAFKDPVDTRDMRSTANADVNYAMDAPPFDAAIVSRLRDRGAIIYAKANAHEYNAGPGNPGGPAEPTTAFPSGAHALSSWSGQSCNPYDTERETRGSSSGSGASVAANLVMCAVCEQTGGSCKGPASRNNVVSLLTTHGLVPGAGGFPNQFIVDRYGIICREVGDAAQVLDALRNEDGFYFSSDDIYTALPDALVSAAPYASFVADEDALARGRKPLAGIRVGVVREYFVKHAPNDVAISDQIDGEVKRVLRDLLGAELVESIDPLYGDDPDVPNMEYSFSDAFAEIVPRHMPEYFGRTSGGSPLFAVPGYDVTSYDYMLQLTLGLAPLSPNMNLRTITGGFANALDVKFGVERYLILRGDARVVDWASLFANARWRDDEQRAGAENWIAADGLVSEGREGRIKMRETARLSLLKVMHENGIDVFVAPENTLPHRKIGGPSEPSANGRGASGATQTLTALLGLPEIVVPAGYYDTVYEPEFVLDESRTEYDSQSGAAPTRLSTPLPTSMMLWAAPGDEPVVIQVASAYQAATRHRVPPPAFGPVPGEP